MTHTSVTRIATLLLAFILAVAPAALAQSTMVKGKVVDKDGKPMVGVTITVEFQGGVNRKLTTKTDKRGEYIQLLTESGQYKVSATDPKIGTAETMLAVRLGRVSEANIVLAPNTTANNDAKAAELRKTFDEGVGLSRGGNHDAAIEKFQAAAAMTPTCFDCYYNIGVAYMAKKDEKQAEAAWQKALELKADYSEALNALSTLYNNQKRFDEAAAMSAKAAAAGGGCRRQRRRGVQPGHHPVEPGQDRRGQGQVRGSDQGQSEPGRCALSARHGPAERRQAARGGWVV